jgi:hypothetical protein
MSDEYYTWCCKVAECLGKNRVPKKQVDAVRSMGITPIFTCGNCGYAYHYVKRKMGGNSNWLECIRFTGRESRIPTGGNEVDGYSDAEGETLDRIDFIQAHGVDPEKYLQWKNGNKKEATVQC